MRCESGPEERDGCKGGAPYVCVYMGGVFCVPIERVMKLVLFFSTGYARVRWMLVLAVLRGA